MTTTAIVLDDGARTILEVWGERGPTIVCVHGMTSSRKAWTRLAERFDGRCRVAAYDQRGCLSPHAVFVQRGKACDGKRFAKLLADELDALAASWPRGTLPAAAAADQLQWRGVAAATCELHARESCAVSYAGELPLRASPGYRNVAVHDVADVAALRARLAPLSVQLKALGVASAGKDLAALADAAPYVCAIGSMQEPPLDAALDGLHPLTGF